MKHSHQVEKLGKFLAYMLGRRPDEFGLVPDRDGYVKTKDLLKALSEEPGWRHVRLNHLREVTFTSRSHPVELTGNLIRAVDRSRLGSPEIADDYPKLLYFPIRRRAYPVVLEKGIPPHPAGDRITLTLDQTFANRLGKRIDQTPIILVVHSASALSLGATLWRFGERLYLLDRLPVDSFSGPPPPKQPQEPQKATKAETKLAPPTPGSFLLDPQRSTLHENRSKKPSQKRKNAWKRERKRKNRRNGFD